LAEIPESLARFAAAMPKAELHVHLEGSIQPATLLRLARRHRVDLPADDEHGLRRWFRFRDFEHFVHIYLTCCRCLRDPEDFQLVLEEFLAGQQRQNVLYSEVHFTIGTHLANGVNGGEVAEALAETLDGAWKRHGVIARLIPDIVRDVGPALADQTLEWALAGRGRGVVALGLSGFESSPDEPLREHFRTARAAGLHCVAHAGEHEGPESIRSALETCDAERIGHGIRAVDDPELVADLARREIPLEICPTSNVRLGAVAEPRLHPFDDLRRAGVVVTVNADDPPLFETTITEEYVRLAEAFDYTVVDLAALSWAGLQAAFLEPSVRRALEQEFGQWYRSLGVMRQGGRFVLESPSSHQ
jgi:adenosine deaminase